MFIKQFTLGKAIIPLPSGYLMNESMFQEKYFKMDLNKKMLNKMNGLQKSLKQYSYQQN